MIVTMPERPEMMNGRFGKYKSLLDLKKQQLHQGLRNRGDIAVHKTADIIEESQLSAERDLAIRNLNHDSGMLREVDAALERIGDGTYGVCLHCDEEINPRRLNAIPWARYCVQCQEKIDREGSGDWDGQHTDNRDGRGSEALREILARAA